MKGQWSLPGHHEQNKTPNISKETHCYFCKKQSKTKCPCVCVCVLVAVQLQSSVSYKLKARPQ